MSLTELIAGVERYQKTLTVYNADPAVTARLREHFADRNLVVTEATATAGPDGFLVLHHDDRFVTACAIEDLLGPREQTDPAFEADPYRPVLDHLDETMFTSYDSRQMVAASREIEDRAWRLSRGRLYAGFQQLSIFATQRDLYERLGALDGLDVHVYAVPDGDGRDSRVSRDNRDAVARSPSTVTLHLERSDEIRRSWFVVYDGAGVDVNKCALLAEERDPDSFYGFWTYDPTTVDWIVDHLAGAYGLVDTS